MPFKNSQDGRMHYISKMLQEANHKVLVLLTAFDNHHQEKEIIENIEYCYVKFRKRPRLFFFRTLLKIVNYLFLYINIIKNSYKFDVLVVYPSLDFRVICVLLAKIRNKKVILEINEYPYLKKSALNSFKRKLYAHVIFKFFDGFVVISKSLYQWVNSYKNKKSNILVIPVISGKPNLELVNQTNLPFLNEQYIFHAGSLFDKKDGILEIIEAFCEVKKTYHLPLKLVFTNKIEKFDVFEKYTKLNSPYKNDIIFLGFVDDTTLKLAYSNALLTIVNKKATMQNNYCFATKIAECLAFKSILVTTNFGEAMHYLKNDYDAIVVQHDSVIELKKGILKALYLTDDEKIKFKNNAYKTFLDAFYYQNYTKSLNAFLLNLHQD